MAGAEDVDNEHDQDATPPTNPSSAPGVSGPAVVADGATDPGHRPSPGSANGVHPPAGVAPDLGLESVAAAPTAHPGSTSTNGAGPPPVDDGAGLLPVPPWGQPVPPCAGQPYAAQPYAGQPYVGEPYVAQPFPSQPYPAQPYPAQPYPAQPFPADAVPVPPARPGLLGAPPAPRRPHRWGLGAYVLAEVVFIGVSVLLGALLAGSLTTSAGAIALALSVPTVCAAGLAILITMLRGNGPVVDLGLQLTGRDVGIGLACGFGGLMITIPASVLYVTIVGRSATSAVGEVFGGIRATPVMALVVFLIVVFLAPFCEEVVYRGLLWGAVEKLGASRWWAMAITTVVFAVAHLEFTRTPLLLIVALPIGVARAVTGRLPAGVIAHQINNLLPGVALALGLLGVVPMQ